MATNDFFLNFGSNAKSWADGLSGELKPATKSINDLTTALERYDTATENRKSNGPLDSLFTRLDQVSQKFADLTGTLSSTFDKAIQGIGLLQEDMASLLRSVQGVSSAAKRGPGRLPKGTTLSDVSEADATSAAQLRNAQTLRANVNSANEKMKRLADLNGTLATRMSEAGDKTKILSSAVGGLIGASHNAIRGIDSLEARLSRFGEGVVINAPAGGTSAGGSGMAMAEMPTIMASFVEALRGVTLTVGEANIQAARVVSQIETAAKATTAEALETQRFTTNERSAMQGPQVNTRIVEGSKKPLPVLEGAAWDRPAEAGSYAVGTRKVTFRRADLIPGETFNEQFARTEALDKRFRQVQRTLPTAETVDPQNGRLLQKISDAFFKGGGVHQDYMERIGDRKGLSASASLQESVTANPGARFLAGAQDEKMLEQARAAGLGTTMQQVVTRALEFTTKRRAGVDTVEGTLPMARARQLEEFIAQELKTNPNQTFGAMGDAELSRVRKRMDEDILRAGGYTEERGNHPVTGEPLEGVYHPPQGRLPMLLQDHPDVQALYQGALRRQVKDTEGREYSSGLSAQSQGRREMSQRQELFIDKGRENDTSVSRDRLAQNYALPTQLNRYQEHLAAAQREHEKALAAHVDIMEDVATGNVFSKKNPDGVTPQQIQAAKIRRDSTAASVQNWQAEVDGLREKITEQKKSTTASVEGSKDAAKRYDEISTNARAARALVRGLPRDVVEQVDRPIEEPILPSRQRAAELRQRRTEAERLLASLKKDPEGFEQRSQATIEGERTREHERALEEQRIKQATINERLAAATAAIPSTAADRLAFQRRMESASPAAAKRMAREQAAAQAELTQVLEERRSGIPLVERPVTLPPETRFSNVSVNKARQRLKDEIEGYTNELQGTGRREFGTSLTAEARAERIRPQLTAFGIPAAKAATLAFGSNAQIEKALLEAAEKMDAAAVKQQQAADKAEAKQDREDGFTTTPAIKRQPKSKKAKKFGQVGDVETDEEVLEEEAAPSGKKKRSGAEANLSGEASATERTAATKILNDRKAVLQVEHDEILARRQAAEQGKRDLGGNRQANRRNLSEEQVTALDGFVAESAVAKEELTRVNQEMHALNTEVLRLRGKVKQAADATTPATATGGGAGAGGRPPRPPMSTGGGGDEPPSGKGPTNDPYHQEILNRRLATFSQETQEAIAKARQQAAISAQTKSLSDEQKTHILNAAQQFRSDPAFKDSDRETARRTFAAGLGLPRSATNNIFLRDTFKPGGLLSADPMRDATGAGTASQMSAEKMARLNGILAQSSGKVREALLAEFAVQERLNRLEMSGTATAEQLAMAKRQLSVASRNVATATEQEADGGAMPGGLSGLLAHGGRQAVRFMSFQIAFTGLEKVRELVDTGIQAQTEFIRLDANLKATGESSDGLMDKLGKISSQTAQPLAHTIQAAAELTGVLKGEDLVEGSKIASELANISHGHLTATQAAIGLRDVTDAYGLSGVKALRGVGDMIARISQVTGVSVHDVIEGTTQLAQEAHSFGLDKRTAAVLAAEVTKNTGESGQAAAEQVSRILSTMNNTKVQQQLEMTVVPDKNMEGQANKNAGQAVATQELFASTGGAGKALTNLLSMYDQLSERQRQSIDALVGTGRQARALTGMLRDSASIGPLLAQVADDEGALASQSKRFLETVGGALQKLGADFRRLGADMLEAHLFDILMLVVTALDHLMTTADSVIRTMNNLFNSNPVTQNLMRMAILLGEVSLAFKVFGSAGSVAMTKIGLGGFVSRFTAGRATQAAAQAEATAAAPLMFGRTRVMWGMGREAVGGLFSPSASAVAGAGATVGRTAPVMVLPASQRFVPGLDTATGRVATPLIPAIPATQRFIPGLDTATGSAIETEATRVRVGAAAAAANLGSLGASLGKFALSVAGPMLALSALIALVDQFAKAGRDASDTKKHTANLLDDITGKSAADRKKDAEKTNQDAIRDKEADAAKRREGDRSTRKGVGGFIKDVLDVPLEVRRTRDLFTGDTSAGVTSNKFETDNANNFLKYGKMLDDAQATKDPKKVVEAQKAIDKAIGDGAEKLIKSAGDRNAQDRATSLLWELKNRLDDDAAKRIENLMGVKDLDILSLQQLENIQTFNTQLSSIDVRTSREDPRALQDALGDTGVNPNSAIGRLGQRALTDDTLQRARDQVGIDRLALPQLDIDIAAKPIGDADRDRLIKAREATFSNLQAQLTLIDQLSTSNPDQMANLLAKVGNLSGSTHQLDIETNNIKQVISTLDPENPAYFQNLNALVDKNQQRADLSVQAQVQDLTLSNARNPNSVSTAQNNAAIAALRLKAARDAANKDRTDLQATVLKPREDELADAKKRQADFVPSGIGRPEGFIGPYINPMDVATQTDLAKGVKAAEDGVKAAQAAVAGSAVERTAAVSAAMAAKAQADQAVTQSLQDQLVAANNLKVVTLQAAGAGTLAMDAQRVTNANQEVTYATKNFGAGSTQESNAKSSALQSAIQQKQDIQDQATSAISLRAAIQANAGDSVGAARSNLAKVNSDLTFAVKTYGKDSKEANNARAAAIAANANLQKEIDDALNAALDLEISMLSNRGNDTDKRQILDDKVKEAQNNLNAFTAKGGKANSPEGKRLTASVNDAKRNRIDQGAQIEIDTLEFQRATFAISASQEIAALQNILKTKQLTQDRARAIMLQIKGLQNEMQGQFNLGDIKLPTVYDVRRTMAAGRAGAAASASTIGYQDNKTINIVINGGNLAKVNSVLSANLGTSATGRVTVAPKKGV